MKNYGFNNMVSLKKKKSDTKLKNMAINKKK